MEIKAETYKLLLQDAFTITLNANDFFEYATADGVNLETDDLPWVLPIVQEYGQDGINAVLAYIRKQEPLAYWINLKYETAMNKLKLQAPEVHSEN
jgi:hypothetical protein